MNKHAIIQVLGYVSNFDRFIPLRAVRDYIVSCQTNIIKDGDIAGWYAHRF